MFGKFNVLISFFFSKLCVDQISKLIQFKSIKLSLSRIFNCLLSEEHSYLN